MTRLITLGELDRLWSGRWNLGTAMRLPVPTIHIHHTVTADTGDPIADGRKVHDIDQSRFGKISYSWLVHESSGSWIEGQTVHRGAHTINNAGQSLNGVSFGVGVIGNFHPAAPIPPPREASDALLELIAAGIREFIVDPGLVSPGFVIDAHRDVFATACCGDSLYDRLPVIRALVSSPPAPPPPPPSEDPDMLVIQHNGDWLLHAGKIVPLSVIAPKEIPRLAADDRQWNFLTKAFGQPVT